jgi:hypothetical protein
MYHLGELIAQQGTVTAVRERTENLLNPIFTFKSSGETRFAMSQAQAGSDHAPGI